MKNETTNEELCYCVWQESNWVYGLGYDYDLYSAYDLEAEVIRQDLFQKLSGTSREIIQILFGDSKNVEAVSKRSGRITKKLIYRFLRESGYPAKEIIKSFVELKQLCRIL